MKELSRIAKLKHPLQYKMRTFKVPQVTRWVVVVNSPDLIDELRKAPVDKLSALAAFKELYGAEYGSRLFKEIKTQGRDWKDKPDDLLSWLIDKTPEGEHRTVEALTQRILALNFAAVHTTSVSFTHALFHLVSRPEYIALLREEVNSILGEGWSNNAIHKMRKMDSFLKESQRYSGLALTAVTRKALADFTLSDGTFLPKGTHITCNAIATHRDDKNYARADVFDGFRFVSSSGDDFKLVSTSLSYLPFGHGRFACPGRVFAATVEKTMLAYLVHNYDMKLEEGVRERPKDFNFESLLTPNQKAHILFRRRQL
ncbi:hypothetical protein EW145_g2710 [Phellinidium pouzarii]|uniref:Cytochrome P450 n=1 Tax=Phellinidium pouzarii TaxID=167371 RepID=A0A4V3XD52_9AGAM|nr:hypothetical protein EW145_g2710 [Phellinidium pouzarii]